MAFVDALFPNPKLIHGLKRKHHWATNIVSNGASEYRLSKQDAPRREWIWQARAMSREDLDAIYDFLIARKLMLESFKFHCPKDNVVYHVRLNQNSIDETFDALDRQGNVLYETMFDISLIEVFE